MAASCSNGPEIVGTSTSIGGGKKPDDNKDSKKNKDKKGGALFPDDEEGGVLFDEDGNLREEAFDGDETNGATINYPTMDLTGNGNVTCKAKVYGVHGQYTNTVDKEKVDLNFYQGSISGAGKGQDKANRKIQESLGQTVYSRISSEERAQYVKDGMEIPPFAIFGKQAVKTKTGNTFIFSKPLPVFPLPAAPARYEKLKEGPQSWTAEVSGTYNFTVTMTVSLVSVDENTVILKFQTDIPQDTNRTLYEAWPLARESTFAMSPKALEVRSITSVNWFNDDDSCGGPETLTINFQLCKKTVAGNTTTFPCQ